VGLVHRVVSPFTPQLSLVLINRPRRDGTLSWHWYTAAMVGIRTRDRHRTTQPQHTCSFYILHLNLSNIGDGKYTIISNSMIGFRSSQLIMKYQQSILGHWHEVPVDYRAKPWSGIARLQPVNI